MCVICILQGVYTLLNQLGLLARFGSNKENITEY